MNKELVKKILYIVAIILLLGMVVFNQLQVEEIDGNFLNSFEEFDSYEIVNNSPVIYEVSKDGNIVGYLSFDDFYGYQSSIMTATLVNMQGIIEKVEVYEESETPSFMYKIDNSSFFSDFKGIAIADGVSINYNIDAITNATISSNAITQGVHSGVSIIGTEFLNISVTEHSEGGLIGNTEIALIIMFALAIFATKTKKIWLKLIVRVYSMIILGFVFNQFITLSAFVSILNFDLPNILNNFKWYILVFGAIFLILVTGKNLYCAFICPFGSLQYLEFKIAKVNFFKLNPKVAKVLMLLPGLLAYFALILALGVDSSTVANYEPFALIFGRTGIGVQWVLLPIVLVGSLFVMNFYCKFGCPVGFVLNQITKLRRKVVRLLWKK